eukprot:TRINITY_DN2491_c0_g1_i1.p1 TRINITY_DN2491_c0_g1~~TRINITY_DN2491_c0_g1_i1.p1  ORF type:complete len:286 (+),score=58.41 TRINITY_DN2491_c0_g1_i1:32-859(+)
MEALSMSEAVVVKEKNMLSRFLYTNPVCMLTSNDVAQRRRNVMTISWLTPINNQGEFSCSMNAHRYSASIVKDTKQFVLNVPVHGQEELIKRIGGCSGSKGDKLSNFRLPLCRPGWFPLGVESSQSAAAAQDEASAADDNDDISDADLIAAFTKRSSSHNDDAIMSTSTTSTSKSRGSKKARKLIDPLDQRDDIALANCVAHIQCDVLSITEHAGHLLMICAMQCAYVQRDYWDGKTFAAVREGVAPTLTFLGSQQFAVMKRVEYPKEKAADVEE